MQLCRSVRCVYAHARDSDEAGMYMYVIRSNCHRTLFKVRLSLRIGGIHVPCLYGGQTQW